MPRVPSARDSEFDEAEARCHSNPSAAIEAAKRGSHIDLTTLSENAGRLPAKVARDAFVLFCSKLVAPSMPRPSSSALPEIRTAEYREASCAVIGISKIGITFLNVPSEKAYYMPLFLKFWDKLLKSTEYVLIAILNAVAASPDPNAIPSSSNLTGLKSATFSNVAGLYTMLFHASNELARDHRSAKIVAKIWAKTVPSTDPHISASAHAMKVLCFMLGHDCWQALDCLIQECGNTVDRVAEIAKERLVVSLKRNPIDYEEVESHVEAILMLSDDERRSFRSSFLKIKGIGVATDGFLLLAKDSSPITDKKKQAIEACTSFYYHMFRSEVGIPWIVEGTRRGLFEILARLSPAYTGDEKARLTVDNVKDLFSLFLPKHLVYYSIIGAVGVGFDRCARILSAFSNSNVKNDWRQFCAVALERIIQKHIYEKLWASDKKGMTIICSTCSKVDLKNTYRRCSGCMGAMYCSKECQVEDWKNKGHKTHCKYLAAAKDIAPLRHKDDKFIATFAQQEIYRYTPGLRKIAERDFPGVSQTKLGYVIDCTTIPLTLGHFPLEGEPTLDRDGQPLSHARPALRKMALEKNGEGALVTLRLQQGTGYQEKNIMIGLSDRAAPHYPTSFPRLVGRDAQGNILETRSDVVVLILHDLKIKDPVSWLFDSPTPVEHLCRRIDEVVRGTPPARSADAPIVTEEVASTIIKALLSPSRLLGDE